MSYVFLGVAFIGVAWIITVSLKKSYSDFLGDKPLKCSKCGHIDDYYISVSTGRIKCSQCNRFVKS